MNVGYAAVIHPSRADLYIENIEKRVDRDFYTSVDDDGVGEWANHAHVIDFFGQRSSVYTHVVILQDDAIPIDGFAEHAEKAIAARPNDLISFYTGTGYPKMVQRELEFIKKTAKTSWLEAKRLYWGVGVAFPTSMALDLVKKYDGKPYDDYLGRYFASIGRRISYTWPCFVDHADIPSLVHADGERQLARNAHTLGPQTDPMDQNSVSFWS